MGTLRRTCAKLREPSELRFGVVAEALVYYVVQGEGEVLEVFVPRFLLYHFQLRISKRVLLGLFLELRGA